MEHLAALMLVIACGNTPESCAVHPAPVTGYETLEACQHAIAPALGRAGTRSGVLVARCLPIDPMDEREMEIVWDVTTQDGLQASVRPVDEPAPETPANALVAQAAAGEETRALR